MEFSTLERFPKAVLDQIIARYGKPVFEPRWMAFSPDGGDIPVAYASEEDARDDGVRHTRKVFRLIWTVDDARKLESDINILSAAIHMEDCPVRNTYICKARDRGYDI